MNSRLLLIFVLFTIFNIYGINCLYGPSSKIHNLKADDFKKVLKSNRPWIIKFYAPWCGHCKSMTPAYEKAAAALDGIVQFGAVDMTTDQEVGAPYGIKGFPTIKFFGANKNTPIDYNGGRDEKSFVDFLLQELRKTANEKLGVKNTNSQNQQQNSGDNASKGNSDDVIVLTDSNFDELVMKSDDMWFIEFYAPWCGHCKALAPHWDTLGTSLKEEVKIAKLDADVNKQIAARLGINSFPQIKLFPYGKKSDSNVENYDGPRDAEAMEQWIMDKKKLTQPVRFEQMVNQDTYNKFCVNIKRGACLIAFLPHIYDSSAVERNGYLDKVRAIAEKHKTSFVTFQWSQGGDQYEFEEALNLGTGYPAFVAVSHAKQVYTIMRGAFTEQKIEQFVSNLLAGKESLSKFRGEIPKIKKVSPWDGKDKKQETTDDYSDL